MNCRRQFEQFRLSRSVRGCLDHGRCGQAAMVEVVERAKNQVRTKLECAVGSVACYDLRPAPLLLSGLLLLAVLAAAGCRIDMHLQPRYNPFGASSFFADGRSERPMVPGTVPHGVLRTDELRYTGKINGVAANEFPFPITRADLERGRERFNIYCTPCHDYTGSGHGMMVQRGFQQPPSYHSDRLRNMPVGHFFDVISNGYGAMYSYAGRVEPDDRWRIAAYIRALQASEHATLNDVPADQRQQFEQRQ